MRLRNDLQAALDAADLGPIKEAVLDIIWRAFKGANGQEQLKRAADEAALRVVDKLLLSTSCPWEGDQLVVRYLTSGIVEATLLRDGAIARSGPLKDELKTAAEPIRRFLAPR